MLDERLNDLVTDHAVGGLDGGRVLLVESLATLKPEISNELAALEAAGAGLLADMPPEPLPAGVLDRLLARLDEPMPLLPTAEGFPTPLGALVSAAEAQGRWQKRLPGIAQLNLKPVLPAGTGTVFLLKAEPGRRIPRHTHQGEEYVLVLAGGLIDERGRFGVGDVAIGDGADTHEPIAAPGETCVCLIVADGAPAFTGFFGAVARAWEWVQSKL